MTAKDLVIEALIELGVPNAAGVPNGEDVDLGLTWLNGILDTWNAKREGVYADVLTTYPLTPSLQPHTIGPTGTFVVTQRPEEIQGANYIVNSQRTPIGILTIDQWRRIASYALTGSYQIYLYYQRDWPNGKLYFWPVVSAANTLEIQTRMLLTALTLPTTFTMPPGYHVALRQTLAEALGPSFLIQPSESTMRLGREARALIFGNNIVMPTLQTRDAGMPGSSGGTYNYLTGRVE